MKKENKKIKLKTMYDKSCKRKYGKSHHIEIWDWVGGIGLKHISTLDLDGIVLDIKEIKRLKNFIDRWLKNEKRK